MRKSISKVAAVVTCFGFLTLPVSGAHLSKKKALDCDFSYLIAKPIIIISSMLPFLNPILFGNKSTPYDSNKSNKQFKISGGLNSPIICEDD